jgi:hypothetical protein
MFDDSSLQQNPDTDIVAFYIGGDTPHVWTDAEIHATYGRNRYRLPIFVRSNPAGMGEGHLEGGEAVAWMMRHHMPRGTTVALDYEAAIDDPYLEAFDAVVTNAGYKTMLYGSESTVLSNHKPSGGYWVALWNNNPNLPNGWAAHQYASDQMLGKSYDLSVVADWVPLWDMNGGPTPPPPPNDQWTESLVNNLPTLSQGATGDDVRTLQGLLNSRGIATKIDGDFGPATEQGVLTVQHHFNLTPDGIVGKHTWGTLITATAQ